MKAEIDRSGCIGCGICEEICPNVFRIDDEGLAEVYADIEEADEEKAIEARDSCPVSVISIED